MSSDLKQKFDGYKVQPDPSVWLNIEKSLRRRTRWRRCAITVAALGATVAVSWVAFALAHRLATPHIAEHTVSNATVPSQQPCSAVVHSSHNDAHLLACYNKAPSASSHSTVQQYALPSNAPSPAPSSVSIPNEASQQPDTSHNRLSLAPPISRISSAPVLLPTSSPVVNATLNRPVPDSIPDVRNNIMSQPLGDEPVLSVPNALLPNDPNPVNHRFAVACNVPLSDYHLYIYNRRGNLVFSSSDMTEVWDVALSPHAVEQGSYVYVIQYTDVSGRKNSTRGTVTVIK